MSNLTLETAQQTIHFGNDQPLVLIAGLNVLESLELTLSTAQTIAAAARKAQIPFVFKASFDKANRSSMLSFRGPGLATGLDWLAQVRAMGVPVITDVHTPEQAPAVAEVCDILQVPAFLSRQTDLIVAIAKTGKLINVKKAQFLAPLEMRHILQKCHEAGNEQVMLCERGTSFGYNNLIVDFLGFDIMKQLQAPLIFDVTHALQLPGAGQSSAGGRRSGILPLAKAGVAQGIAGVFLEVHPDPQQAKCDGPCALALNHLSAVLEQLVELDRLVKGFAQINTD